MIVRMSKIRMVGPKALLQRVLSLLRESGIFQIEPSAIGFLEKGGEEYVRSFLLDEKDLSERIFLDGLRLKLEELFSYLPNVPSLESMIEIAAFESKLKRLGAEILKTTRKIRVLEERVLPDLKDQIKMIAQYIGERDREAYYRLKRFKTSCLRRVD
jgi:vacuolar-type H+-ATPase subunit I/STV1